jgi:uncharacterized protein YqjF (DUF2071 family)/predicted DCC family thiol-disulfide oxidoreductase YuxK
MSDSSTTRDAVEPEGWVLYDGGCGVCTQWVPFWAPTLARLGLDIAPLEEPWVASRLHIPPEKLTADIRLLFRDGRQLAGADVYRYVMRRLWWAYPLYLLAVAPGSCRLFEAAYRAFANNRLGISASCGLRPVRRPAPPRPTRRPFLTAEWRYLVMLNYEVDRSILEPLVPADTELDLWQGRALVSVVGFKFANTRVRGVAVPFHQTFDEVNLRFYVRRELPTGEMRRGVVFVRELVPRTAIALLARIAYNEPYHAVAMRSTVPPTPGATPGRITYEWRTGARWQRLAATAVGACAVPAPSSEAAFITQHHWGYTRQRDGSTVEYEVEHPVWRVWDAALPVLDADVCQLYGEPFARALSIPPTSALIAEGSPVVVYPPVRLPRGARVGVG